MFRVLFLVLILMNSIAFAQTADEKLQAKKTDEFGQSTNGYMEALFDSFYSGLNNDPASRGSIIIYGSARQITRQEKIFKTFMGYRRVDAARISIIKGGQRNEMITQFWIIPLGAENPPLDPTARKIADFGKVTNGYIKMQMNAFFTKLDEKKDSQGYIYNYGTTRENAVREKIIRDTINFRRNDSSRITLVNGGKGSGLNTILWIVPENAEVPKP